MSRLVARILLTIFMLPAGALVYISTCIFAGTISRFRSATPVLIAGAVTWLFVAAYWVLLWRTLVRWTKTRIVFTVGGGVVAALIGAIFGASMELVATYSRGELACLMGSMATPALWLIITVFVWRETTAERTERLAAAGRSAVACPSCGYNLTGLNGTRCPECGTQFTIDELLAAQRGSVQADMGDQ